MLPCTVCGEEITHDNPRKEMASFYDQPVATAKMYSAEGISFEPGCASCVTTRNFQLMKAWMLKVPDNNPEMIEGISEDLMSMLAVVSGWTLLFDNTAKTVTVYDK